MDNARQPGSEQRLRTICMLVLSTIAVGVALYFLRPVLIPFVLAVFLVYCLTPAIDAQVKHLRMPRAVAVLSTVLLGCLVLTLLWLLIWASVSQMLANAGYYEQRFEELVDTAASHLPLEELGIGREAAGVDEPTITKIEEAIEGSAEPGQPSTRIQVPWDSARGVLTRVISAVMSLLSNGLLVVIFMIFLMAGTVGRAPHAESFWGQVETRVKRYILTKVFVSTVTGTLVGLTLWLLNVELALVFGVLAFLLNFIPNIGSVIATLLPLPVVLLGDLPPAAKVLAIAIPGCIQFLVGNIIEPKIMGESLDLSPIVILLGLIFFGMIWGIVGMILATPIVAVLKIVLERSELTSPVARLLAGRLEGA
ncbi:MAG: AI-2E family transporter [Planctomycetota bacterium]